MKKLRFSLSTTQLIMASFLVVILIGALLLALPVSSASGTAVSFTDALFTSTSATCVTGLVTLPTFSAWSIFGKVVILCLIQVGGLGTVTIVSGIMLALHRRMGLGNRLLIQDAFNLNSMSGLVRFVKRVILGTLAVETVGALLYMTVFVPQFGVRGIFISIFNSISAFCNAGMDIISENSLCAYAENPVVCFVTCALIILGGIGYVVWWDVAHVVRDFPRRRFRCFKRLTIHSKIALSATAFFVLAGAAAFFILEYSNPSTIGEMSLGGKLQASFFQSVTTRTAGFATVPQQNLTNASSFVSIFLMFIGGSPVGTAGGIKTVTLVVLAAAALTTVRGKSEVTLFGKSISRKTVGKSWAVAATSAAIIFVSTVLLSAVTDRQALDIMYETVSAAATVGLSRDLTPFLDTVGKLIVTVTMYLGRVGPISLVIALNVKRENVNLIRSPEEEISVG